MHELVEFLNQHDIVKAFGLSLLHSLWQGAIIAVLLWALLKISARLSAGVRHCFALTALGSLLICFAITFNTQLNSLHTAEGLVDEATSFIIISDQAGAAAATETNLLQELEKGWNLLLYQARQYVGYFFLAWTIGFLIFSFRFFTGLYYLRDLKQLSRPLPESWTKKVDHLKTKLGLHQNIRLLASERATTPLTFGWLRPVIIFPLSMISLLPDEQVESILLHELAHIRRNDYLLNLLQSIVEIIFFFNPAYWYLSKVLEQEREHVCDDMVLAHSPDPHIYARALTRLAELSAFNNNRLAMHIARKEMGLLFRIKRIIQPSKSHIMERSIKRRSYQLASLIVACSLLVFLTIDVNGNNGQASLSQEEQIQPAATETASQISGVVLSKYGGASLPGVAVTIKNSNTGTVTDFDGNFSLNAQPTDTLVFSFVGFHAKELAVNNQNYHAVVLESIEKTEDSRVVIENIEVKENSDAPAPTTITKNGGNAAEEGTRIFIIPEDEDIKAFFRYIKGVDMQDIEHRGREISKAELDAIDPAKIKSNLTISSEESGYKKAVTLIKLKGAEDKTKASDSEENSRVFIIPKDKGLETFTEYIFDSAETNIQSDIREITQRELDVINKSDNKTSSESDKPVTLVKLKRPEDGDAVTSNKQLDSQPVIFLFPQGALGSAEPGTEEFKAALAKGRQISDVKEIHPKSISSIQVLKGDDALAALGEAGKNGVLLISLKAKAKPAPMYILLEEDILGAKPGSQDYETAIARGQKLDDPHSIDPATIASMHVLKGSTAISNLGDAAKNGVVFITLKTSETSSDALKGKAEDRFTVFPNPSDGIVKVRFRLETKQHVKLDVLDPNGNKVYIFVDQVLNKGTHQYEWDASDRQAGLYTITFSKVNEVKTRKLVLE